MTETAQADSPWRIATLFGRLGVTAFGGPAAHIALFEEEFVARRGWLSRQHLLDVLGATHLQRLPVARHQAQQRAEQGPGALHPAQVLDRGGQRRQADEGGGHGAGDLARGRGVRRT